MGLILFREHVAEHPATHRLHKRQGRRLRAVRPSHAEELHYRAQLGLIVDQLRAADREIAEATRSSWPRVADSAPPGFLDALHRAEEKFRGIGAVANRLVDVSSRLSITRRNLRIVDERLTRSIHGSVGVDISRALHATGRIEAAMQTAARANFDLITSIPRQHFDELRTLVERGFGQGLRWEEMAKQIAARAEVTESRAQIIARDQTSKMNASFNEVRQTGLGIEEYDWSGALDQRERTSHRAMEGRRCRWDSPPSVDGENVHPGQAILCRCVPLPVVNLRVLELSASREELAA